MHMDDARADCISTSFGIFATKKPPRFPGAALELFPAWRSRTFAPYFFFLTAFALRFSSMAACAAANRATGTRYGEQLT